MKFTLKETGLKAEEIANVIEAQIYEKVKKALKKQRRKGANNLTIFSDGENISVFVCKDNSKIVEVEFESIILSPLQLKLARAFASRKLDEGFFTLKNFLMQSGTDYVLLPVGKIIKVYSVEQQGYKEISIKDLVGKAYEFEEKFGET